MNGEKEELKVKLVMPMNFETSRNPTDGANTKFKTSIKYVIFYRKHSSV